MRDLRRNPGTRDLAPVLVLAAIATTTPTLQIAAQRDGCPTMGVPLSAGAFFVDSQVVELPELGMRYLFEDLAGHSLEVIDYPADGLPDPAGQIRNVLASFDSLRSQGRILGFEVRDRGFLTIQVPKSPSWDSTTFGGYGSIVRLDTHDGFLDWHAAVFPWRDRYVQLRGLHPAGDEAVYAANLFMSQLLSARASRPEHCR